MNMKMSYKNVEAYCNELHNIAMKMKTTMNEIESMKNTLASGGPWNGKASTHYSSNLNDVTSNFNEIISALENSILYMAKCSDGYQAIDEKVMSEICINLNISSSDVKGN